MRARARRGHFTVFRWVQRRAPEINKSSRRHLKMSGTSYGDLLSPLEQHLILAIYLISLHLKY